MAIYKISRCPALGFTVPWPYLQDKVCVHVCVWVCCCLTASVYFHVYGRAPCTQGRARGSSVLWLDAVVSHPASPPPPHWGRRAGTTTLSNLGCVCMMGNNLQSESHQLRKQLSQWGKKISQTGYLAWWKESSPLFGYSFHFPAGHCDTEAGFAYTNAFNSFDPDYVYTALKPSGELLNRVPSINSLTP